MVSWHTELIESSANNVKFAVYEGAKALSNQDFLNRLQSSVPFRDWYSNILTDTRFDAFFWENKPIMEKSLSKPYECNVVRSPFLSSQSSDKTTFRKHFDHRKEVVTFSNLGKDAHLIAPVHKHKADDFAHLARFLRKADNRQIDAFWKTVAGETLKRIGDKPVWLSTSGVGVYWLHARIDTYPKYYQTEDYKTP